MATRKAARRPILCTRRATPGKPSATPESSSSCASGTTRPESRRARARVGFVSSLTGPHPDPISDAAGPRAALDHPRCGWVA